MSIAHDNVKARYQQMAFRRTSQMNEARKKVFAAVPRIAEMEEALTDMNLDILQSGLNKSLDRDALIVKRDALIKEKQQLLTQNGFAADVLDEKFSCDLCQDTGVTPNGKRCACYNRYLLEERLKDSGLPTPCGTFEAFDAGVFSQEKGVEKVSQQQYMLGLKARCEKYADEAQHSDVKNLILMGNAGTGKSYLAQAVVSRMLKKDGLALYVSANQLFTAFYNHRMGESVDLESYYAVPLLAIDDLGTEIMTKNVTIEYFYNLINERQIRGKATVIATNLNPESFLARYGDRIYSRLFSKASAKYLIPALYPDVRK